VTHANHEVTFHRYFAQLAPYLQDKYHGRLDFSRFGVPELASAFEAIRDEINVRWSTHANRILAPDGAVDLYLDYINSTEVNAITFFYDGTHFVGITDKMLIRFSEAAGALWGLDALKDLLRIELSTEVRNFLFQAILLIQLQFISSHELGHLFHGHIDRTILQEEFCEALPQTQDLLKKTNRLKDQAHEVEADGYAVHMLLDNLVASNSGDHIYRRLGSKLPREDCIFTLLLLAVGSVFFFLKPREFDEEAVRALDHPFAVARMNVVLYDLIGWCSLNRPGLEGWASVESFQWVMACIGQAANQPEQWSAWARQGEFLKNPAGKQYMADLYAEREKLRADMASRSWKITPPADVR